MKTKIKVHPETGFAYIPKEAREHGYTGEVESVANHFTWIWIKPGASQEQVKKSLEIMLADLKNAMTEEKEESGKEVALA